MQNKKLICLKNAHIEFEKEILMHATAKTLPTITIDSLSEYIRYITETIPKDRSSIILESGTMYRGQANAAWPLVPGIYRKKLLHIESLMLKRMRHLYPEEFLGDKLDILTKMQHFGMPTRLLDTTTNPLVALFFACNSTNEQGADGAVFVFPDIPIMWSDDDLLQIVLEFVFTESSYKTTLTRLHRELKDKFPFNETKEQNIYSTFERVLTHPAYAVMPSRGNPRIKAQDGAFYIFGMSIKEKTVNINSKSNLPTYTFDTISIDSPLVLCRNSQKIIIPAENKASILRDLKIVGIDEQKLFPDLSHQINSTVDNLKNNIVFDFV